MPIVVQVLYFAATRDAAGLSSETVTLPEDTRTIADLARFLERRHPALSGRLDQVRFAVNECFVEASATPQTGDVVALIPPVSGG